jgi:hypothetical protein
MRRTFVVLLGSVSLIAWQAPAFAQTCSCPPSSAGVAAGAVIRADEPPPRLPVYDQPPIPAPGYIWTPGYWAWNNYDYYWVPGTWVEPPHPGLLWTPGYWGFVDGIYAFHRGYWGERVGFYGGVAYGFGYSGNGYDGGRWDNGRFFYNRVVNNFGDVHVTNVYEKTIVNNQVNSRVSFNGGNGGIQARPTPAEATAAREQHVPPTQAQVNHARTASMDGALFKSTNHGRPTIAATPRPAAFNGPGVVRAKEGGPTAPSTAAPTEPRHSVAPGHPAADTTFQQPEVAPSPRSKTAPSGAAPATREPEHGAARQPEVAPSPRSKTTPMGAAPARHEPEHGAAPDHPPHTGLQDQHAVEHNSAPAQKELRHESHSAAPASGETRHSPAVEHPPMSPRAQPSRVEAPHIERPAGARPEGHAVRPTPGPEPHAAARPQVPHPAAQHGPAPHGPAKRHEEDHR